MTFKLKQHYRDAIGWAVDYLIDSTSPRNVLESRTSAAAFGASAITLEQTFNLLPENIRPYVQLALICALFFYKVRGDD